MRSTSPRRVLIAAATLLLLVSACSSGSEPEDKPVDPAPTGTSAGAAAPYMALGDSFSAGPGIDPQQADAGACLRSDKNWPNLLAEQLEVDIRDVTCSGATTGDLASAVSTGAVPATTKLVTLSIGGNDGALFETLIRSCGSDANVCTPYVQQEVPTVLAQTKASLGKLLDGISTAAPDAQVVLVGYPQIMPASGTCSALGISADLAASVRAAEEELDVMLSGAADLAGIQYVSLRTASKGHDVCAGAQAWLNGAEPSKGDGISFHPKEAGEIGIAKTVDEQVSTDL